MRTVPLAGRAASWTKQLLAGSGGAKRNSWLVAGTYWLKDWRRKSWGCREVAQEIEAAVSQVKEIQHQAAIYKVPRLGPGVVARP